MVNLFNITYDVVDGSGVGDNSTTLFNEIIQQIEEWMVEYNIPLYIVCPIIVFIILSYYFRQRISNVCRVVKDRTGRKTYVANNGVEMRTSVSVP